MNKLRLKLIAFFAVLALTVACSIDNENNNYCYTQAYEGITAVTGPETAAVNVPVTFDVTIKIANSCGSFAGFNENRVNPRKILAVVTYSGCECTQQPTTVTKQYQFKATQPGEYVLNFTKSDGSFISKTVTVTE